MVVVVVDDDDDDVDIGGGHMGVPSLIFITSIAVPAESFDEDEMEMIY